MNYAIFEQADPENKPSKIIDRGIRSNHDNPESALEEFLASRSANKSMGNYFVIDIEHLHYVVVRPSTNVVAQSISERMGFTKVNPPVDDSIAKEKAELIERLQALEEGREPDLGNEIHDGF